MSTTQENVYNKIKELLYSGNWKSGERLAEVKIAKELNVSRNPIREALLRLASEGLVERIPGVGCRVVEVDVRTIRDMYQVREALEGMAARLAAERIDESTLLRLRQECDFMLALGDDNLSDRYSQSDNQFHRLIMESSANKLLLAVWQEHKMQVVAIRNILRTSKILGGARNRDPKIAAESHLEILTALETFDPDGAEAAIRAHIRGALADYTVDE